MTNKKILIEVKNKDIFFDFNEITLGDLENITIELISELIEQNVELNSEKFSSKREAYLILLNNFFNYVSERFIRNQFKIKEKSAIKFLKNKKIKK